MDSCLALYITASYRGQYSFTDLAVSVAEASEKIVFGRLRYARSLLFFSFRLLNNPLGPLTSLLAPINWRGLDD